MKDNWARSCLCESALAPKAAVTADTVLLEYSEQGLSAS